MKYLLCAVILCGTATIATGAQPKATKDSAVAALQTWEQCVAEQIDLTAQVEESLARLEPATELPEELKQKMREALAKKVECETLLRTAHLETLRYVSGQ